MKRFPGSGAMLALVGCLGIGFMAGGCAASKGAMIVTPFVQAQLEPIDPKQPRGAQIAVLRGDPATGPSSMLMRLVPDTASCTFILRTTIW